ncbi:hypothetical protein [Streptomyces sp. NPDC058335]|uniref:hypothetical protein n=1 Tax=Streptomyces sp. NPDC058335 TaxID=3346451 RepID=UPI0036470A43
MGLASEVVEGEALPRALKLAEVVADNAPPTVRQIKEVVRQGLDALLDAGLAFRTSVYLLMFGTAVFCEGVKPFVDKLTPSSPGLTENAEGDAVRTRRRPLRCQ